MGDSLSAIYIHLIFSTKNRQPFLKDKVLRSEMHSVLGGISRKLGCQPIIVGGVEDHIHLLAFLGNSITKVEWIKELKRRSSLWIKESSTAHQDFAWQRGSGAFSISGSHKKAVIEYIRNQEEHHKKTTFEEEYLRLLNKYDVEYDERYLWG